MYLKLGVNRKFVLGQGKNEVSVNADIFIYKEI